jgi:hypothetical protein
MGQFMKEDDYFIEPLLDILNTRFAPGQALSEMTSLQRRFNIFQQRRSFKDSVRIIHAVSDDRQANRRWYRLLGWLRKVGSDTAQTGSDRIVSALIQNLASRNPQPVYFTYHIATKTNARVRVRPNYQAVPYMRISFLTISLPLIPR